MTTPAPLPVLHIRSVPDLLAVIPRVLGFHPSESLTVVVIDDGRLVVTARVDLEGCAAPDLVAESLGPLWRRYPSALFLAVAHAALARPAWDALDALAQAAPEWLELRCLHADGGRWFDAPDAPGRPYDISTSEAAARAAYEGLVALPGRGDVEASVEPTATPRQVTRALRTLERRRLDHEGLIREALRLVGRADGGSAARLRMVDAAVLTLASHDLAFREAAILSTSAANAPGRVALWRRVVQCSAPSCAGFALAILGLAAWVAGDGALQVVCLQRATGLATDRDWLDFLDRVNRQVVPPTQWEQLRADWFCDQVDAAASGAEEVPMR